MKNKCSHSWTNKSGLWVYQTLRGILQQFLIFTEWTEFRFAILLKVIALPAYQLVFNDSFLCRMLACFFS